MTISTFVTHGIGPGASPSALVLRGLWGGLAPAPVVAVGPVGDPYDDTQAYDDSDRDIQKQNEEFFAYAAAAIAAYNWYRTRQ